MKRFDKIIIKISTFAKKHLSKKMFRFLQRINDNLCFYSIVALITMYLYGILINTFIGAIHNFQTNTQNSVLVVNPIKNILAVFSPQGLGVTFFIIVMYFLISQKGLQILSGNKIIKDERNFYILDEGTHGTSGWMKEREMLKVLLLDSADAIKGPILGKLKENIYDNDAYADYLGLKPNNGLNKHIMVYGASGAGKSRGFVKPFILKTSILKESMIIVDPKGEFFEQMSGYLRDVGYTVKSFNLLDMENSDGWNCIGETSGNADMVQSVAEVIIRNTSDSDQKADFWDKAEMNLLVALILYAQNMTKPGTNELLPIL